MSKFQSILIIISLTFILYSQTLGFGIIDLDDHILISGYEYFSKLSFFKEAFVSLMPPFYRPVLLVSFAVDANIWGLNLFFYHLTNILLHGLVSSLIYLLLVELKSKNTHALMLSALFAIHPLNTQAVAWIPGRNDILLAIFIILSFLYFVKFITIRKSVYLLNHFIFFSLALLTKETAIVFPLVCIFYLLVQKNSFKKQFPSLKLLITWGISILVWYILYSHAFFLHENISPLRYIINNSLGKSSVVNLLAIFSYLSKAIFPYNLSVVPTFGDTNWMLVILSSIVFYLIYSIIRNKRILFFGLFWFIAFLLPSLIQHSSKAYFLEQRAYLPLVGLIISLRFIKVRKYERLLPIIIIWIASLLYVNISHTRKFFDSNVFWEQLEPSRKEIFYEK